MIFIEEVVMNIIFQSYYGRRKKTCKDSGTGVNTGNVANLGRAWGELIFDCGLIPSFYSHKIFLAGY